MRITALGATSACAALACLLFQHAQADDGQRLSLTVRAREPRSLLGGPVGVVLQLTNVSKEEVIVSLDGDPVFSPASQSSAGRDVEPRVIVRIVDGMSPGWRLRPGMSHTRTVYAGRHLRFNLPGHYTLRCSVKASLLLHDQGTFAGVRMVLQGTVDLVLAKPEPGELESLIKRYEKELKGRDGEAAADAVRALAAMRGPEVIRALGKALKSQRGALAYCAARGLAEEGSPEAIRALTVQLGRTRDAHARQVIEMFLRRVVPEPPGGSAEPPVREPPLEPRPTAGPTESAVGTDAAVKATIGPSGELGLNSSSDEPRPTLGSSVGREPEGRRPLDARARTRWPYLALGFAGAAAMGAAGIWLLLRRRAA